MEQQKWRDRDLDKDLLVKNNKEYSHKYCMFLDKNVNYFIADSVKYGKILPVGVSLHGSGMFQAGCNNPFSKNTTTYVGIFKTPEEAHEAWRSKKHEYAIKLSLIQTDKRVACALRSRYI